MAKERAVNDYDYMLGNEWISLHDLIVRRDKIVALYKKFETVSIILENGVELITRATDREGLEKLIYCTGDRVNGELVIREEEGGNNG